MAEAAETRGDRMTLNNSGNPTNSPGASSDDRTLPATLAARLNGELLGQSVVAWAPFDLGESNQYVERFAIVTETRLRSVT